MCPDGKDGLRTAGPHKERYSSRKIFFLLLVCCAGFAYLIWLRLGGTAVPCLFHSMTGLLCPGCGVTRMLLAVSKLDPEAALRANPFLFVTLPYLAVLLGLSCYRWVRNEKIGEKAEASAVIYCIGLVLFGIFRNLA